MKLFSKFLILLLVISVITAAFVGCDNKPNENQNGTGEFIDYASTVKFDPNSGRAHAEVKVINYVDGDTTHFDIPDSIADKIVTKNMLKARYLAINTPESTGLIEPWGKTASNYNKEALKSATSIIIESNDSNWNADSTGERYLVWVWYKTANDAEYRNLNLEMLQAGLAYTSKLSDTCYYDVALKIATQANKHKLYVFSDEKDPDFYYGAAIPLTMQLLKANIEDYANKTVSFEGVVTKDTGTTVFMEEYDEETGIHFGMQIFYGYNLDFFGKQILSVGNRVRVVGSVQYYETGGTWQLSDIKFDAFADEDETNLKLISSGHSAAYAVVEAKDIVKGKVTISSTVTDENDEETIVNKQLDYGFLAMYSTVEVQNLKIVSTYTTNNDGKNDGAISITCEAEDGTKIVLRTVVLYDENGDLVTADSFPKGSIVNAKGVLDAYSGEYQVKIYSQNDITFVEQ